MTTEPMYAEIYSVCNQISAECVPYMPECVGMNFESTGSCGGDAGHGGSATLTIFIEGSTGLQVDVETDRGTGTEKATITVAGDWELTSFADAILALAAGIASQDRVARLRLLERLCGHSPISGRAYREALAANGEG